MSDAEDLAEAKAAYLENADYEETASTTKAAAFITACRRLIGLLPSRSAKGGREGGEFEFELMRIEVQMADARRWLNTASASSVSGRTVTRFMER